MNVIESQVFRGEMYIKASDHHRALEHYRQEVDFWRQRYEALVKAATELSSMRESKPPVMLADKESYEAGRIKGREDGAAAEREACAKVCDEDQSQAGEWTADAHVGGYFAARIRARGQA